MIEINECKENKNCDKEFETYIVYDDDEYIGEIKRDFEDDFSGDKYKLIFENEFTFTCAYGHTKIKACDLKVIAEKIVELNGLLNDEEGVKE